MPALVVLAVSFLGKPMTKDRYLLISMAPAYLLLARAFMRLPARGLPAAATVLFCAGMLYEQIGMDKYYAAPQRQQFREAIRYALENGGQEPGTLLAAYLGQAGTHYTNYYFERLGSPRRFDLHAGRAEDIPRVEAYLKEHAPMRIIFVAVHTDTDPDPRFVEFLKSKGRRPHYEKGFCRAKVWVIEVSQ